MKRFGMSIAGLVFVALCIRFKGGTNVTAQVTISGSPNYDVSVLVEQIN